MMDFSVDDYFANRRRAVAEEDGFDPSGDKFLELRRATEEKVRSLAESSAMAAKREQVYSKTWAGRAGYNQYTSENFQKPFVNLAASMFSGATREMGHVLASGVGAATSVNQSLLSEEDIAALGRVSQNERDGQISTPEDLAQVNRKMVRPKTPFVMPPTPAGMTKPEDIQQFQAAQEARAMLEDKVQTRLQKRADANPNADTPLSVWTRMNKGREVMDAIRSGADYSSIVDQTNREKLSKDLLEGYDPATQEFGDGLDAIKKGDILGGTKTVVTGYAKLLLNAIKAVGNNPMAATEYIAENAPQLFIGAAGKAGMALLTSANVGYGLDAYHQGISDYQDKHGGALPPPEQRDRMAVLAASLVVAEQAGDVLGLGFTKLGATAVKDAAKAVGEGATDATRTSFMKALKETGKAAAAGVASETPTEGYQTWAEGEIAGKPASGAEIYSGAVIGGASGGGLSGGGRGLHEAAKLITQPSQDKPRTEAYEGQGAIHEAAIASGDVSTLLDPKHKAFDRRMAVAALVGHSQLASTTNEQKEANVAKVKEIIADLEASQEGVKNTLKTADEKQADVTKMQDALKALDPADPKTAKLTPLYEAQIQRLTEIAAEPALSDEQIKGGKSQLEKLEQQLKGARTSQNDLDGVITDAKTLAAHITTLSAPADPKAPKDALAADASQAAAVSVIKFAMANPASITADEAVTMASNVSNGLTAPQRQYLRAFGEAQLRLTALKATKGVKKDIYEGSPPDAKTGKINFWGINQYRQEITAAIAAGDRGKAGGRLQTLARFVADHDQKAKIAQQAATQLGNGPQQIQRRPNAGGRLGDWFIAKPSERLTDEKARRTNGAFDIKSTGMVRTIGLEAKALEAAHTEFAAAYALKFESGAGNVADQSQQNVGPKAQQGAAKADAKEATVSPAAEKSDVSGGQSDTVVESSNVEASSVAAKAKAPVTEDDINDLLSGLGEEDSAESISKGDKAGVAPKKKPTVSANTIITDAVADAARDMLRSKLGQLNMGVDPEAMQAGITLALYHIEKGARTFTAYATAMVADMGDSVRPFLKSWYMAAKFDPRADKLEGLSSSAEVEAANVDAIGAKTVEKTPDTEETSVSSVNNKENVGDKSTESNQENTQETKSTEKSLDPASAVDSTLDELSQGDDATATTLPLGTLSSLSQKSPEGTPYHLSNLLAQYFTQDPGKESDNTHRPLVMVKDFLSSLKDGATPVLAYLSDKVPTKKQKAVIEAFRTTALGWAADIRANLPASLRGTAREKFSYEDVQQFFLSNDADGKVDVDENLKTAISAVVYNYVASEATSQWNLKDSAINALLGRKGDPHVSIAARDALGRAGTYQPNLIDQLGGAVIDILGLRPNADAPKNLVVQLRLALGSHALKILEDSGLITRTPISDATMEALREEGLSEWELTEHRRKYKQKDEHVTYTYFAIKRDDKGVRAAAVEKIFQATRDTQDILGKLFKAEASTALPALTPLPVTQKTTANTDQGIPDELKEAIERMQAEPFVIRKDLLKLLGQFSKEDALTMFGKVPEENETTHIVNRGGVVARNEGLTRDYESFIEFISEYLLTSEGQLDTPIYLLFSVWEQQRVGVANTVANPQTSKIIRQLLISPEWTYEVELANEADMTSFYLRVGEGLGYKTERIDNALAVEDIKNKLADKVYTTAITTLHKSVVKGETLNASEQASVLAAVAQGGENAHSLNVLVALAYLLEAENTNATSFIVQVMGEADGVANGTMINHMLLGAADRFEELQAFGNMGGFYEIGHEHTQYNQYRGEPGHQDVYERTAARIYAAITKFVVDSKNSNSVYDKFTAIHDVASIWAIAGNIFNVETNAVTKEGRNLVKDGMNPLGFGSSLKSVSRGMGDTFISAVYGGFERLATQKSKATQEQINEYVANVNQLIGQEINHKLKVGKPLAYYMEIRLGDVAENAIRERYATAVGVHTVAVLQEDFEVFLARRDALNNAAQQVFELTNAVRLGMREAYVQELTKKGELPVNADGVVVGDLNKQQEAVLEKRLRGLDPVIKTPMSKNDKGTHTGMRIGKTESRISTDTIYRNNTKFGVPFKGSVQKSVAGHGKVIVRSNPSVKTGSATTHSSDSAAIHRLLLAVLRVHDAVGAGVGGLQEAAGQLNHNLLDVLVTYSPLEEVYQSMVRAVTEIARLKESGELSPQAVRNLQKYVSTQKKQAKDLSGMLAIAAGHALKADTIKLQTMETWAAVDQYANQGGNYLLTPADHTQITELLAGLQAKYARSDELMKAIVTLRSFQGYKPNVAETTAAVVVATNEASDHPDEEQYLEMPGDDETLDSTTATSLFGPLGKAKITSDKGLLKPFEDLIKEGKKPVITAYAALQLAWAAMGRHESPQMKLFYGALGSRLAPLIPKGLMVTYITPDTDPADIGGIVEDSRGWFDSANNGQIFVMGKMFTASGLTPELIFHEVLHSVLASVIKSAVKGTPAYALVQELEALLVKAKEQVATLDASQQTEFAPALTSIDELLSWGMTSRRFQDAVLSQFEIASKIGSNAFVTGAKAFIDSLVNFFFKGRTVFKDSKSDLVNGMTVLIYSTQGLLSSVAGDTSSPGPAAVEPNAPFKLNEGQQTAYDAVVEFLKSTKESFSVIGSAGTGKTTIVSTILKNLEKEGLNKFSRIVLTSPTHRANAVTRSKNSSAEIVTLHSLLGLKPSVNLEEFNARDLKFVQTNDLSENEKMPVKGLLIVDESSMINDALYAALTAAAGEVGTKIIFLGDMAQLGPVKQTTDSKALISTDGQANLTQVMRAKNAALLDESVSLRETGDFTAVSSMQQGNGVRFMGDGAGFINRAVKFFGSEEFKKNPLLVRVLAFRNATVAKYNRTIREALYGKDAAAYVPGELLMGYSAFGRADETTKMAQISNGVDYLVQSVGKTTTGTLFGVEVDVISLTIKDVFNLNRAAVIQVVSPTTSADKIKEISNAVDKLLTIAKTDRSKWRTYYAEKEKYALPFDVPGNNTTLMVKTLDYGYAHTIHKSQGGTYNFVMVDANDIDAARTEADRKRLRYVGLTRAERGAFVLTNAEITDAPAETPKYSIDSGGRIRAVTFKKQHLVAINQSVYDNATPQQRHALILHEIGVHYGLEEMLGTEEFNTLITEVQALRGKNANVDKAEASIPADTPAADRGEELLGYLVEHHRNMPIVRRLLQAVRDWYAKTFHGVVVTESDVYALAKASLEVNRYKKDIKIAYIEDIHLTPEEGFVKVDFQKAIEQDPAIQDIFERLTKIKELHLTGSLGISTDRNIYRPVDAQIHDLDFMTEMANKDAVYAKLQSEFPNALMRTPWYSKQTDSWAGGLLIPKDPNIVIAFTSDVWFGVLRAFTKDSVTNEVRPLREDEYINVDVFLNTTLPPLKTVKYVTSAGINEKISTVVSDETMVKKLEMGRGKDIVDALRANYGEAKYSKEAKMAMAAQEAEIEAIDKYTTVEVHQALRNAESPLSDAFDTHLKAIHRTIVERLYGPFGAFRELMRENEAGSALDIWAKSKATGQIPFATQLDVGPFPMSEQESFAMAQLEATMLAATQESNTRVSLAFNAISAVFKEMDHTLNQDGRDFYEGPDWATASPEERMVAKAQRDFTFEIKAGSNRVHLARFVALTLGNEKVNRIMQRATDQTGKPSSKGLSWGDRLQGALEAILEFFQQKVLRIYTGQNADEKIKALVGRLVDSEAKRKDRLAHSSEASFTEPLEEATEKYIEIFRQKVVAIADSDFVQKKSGKIIKTAGTVVATVASNRLRLLMEKHSKWRSAVKDGQETFVASMFQEWLGHDEELQLLMRLANVQQGERKEMMADTAKTAITAFAKEGKYLKERSADSRAMRNALSAVFLRTGAHHLLDYFSLAEIEKLVGNPAARDAAIKSFEGQLHAIGFGDMFAGQANGLGAEKALGNARIKHAMQNAYVIARMLGTTMVGQITEEQAQSAEVLIKPLVALYALRYTKDADLTHAKNVLGIENARTDGGNGIDLTLRMHRMLEQESLERSFENNPILMTHGFTSEIYDTSNDIVVANSIVGAALVAKGYVQGGAVSKDKMDPNQEREHIYVMEGGGELRKVTGVISHTDDRGKGTPLHDGYLNTNTASGLANAVVNADIAHDRAKSIKEWTRSGPVPDLRLVKENFLAPVYNPSGQIVNWRYFMAEDTKDNKNILNRNNRFDKILGKIAGTILDRETTAATNLKAITAMYGDYEEEKSRNPDSYVLVGRDSTDPALKKHWDMLPAESQKDVKRIWGAHGMMIRASNLNIMFGYHKVSFAKELDALLEKDPDARKDWERYIISLVQITLGDKAVKYIGRGEKGMQEMVAAAKDIIVVKSGVIALANIKSNFWLLYMMGVPIMEGLRNHLVAMRGMRAHRRDREELARLRLLRNTQYGKGNARDIDRQILMLENSIADNPVTVLIEAGLMPTIVEDIDPEDDQSSYKAAIARKLADVGDNISPKILDIGKWVWMAHDTPMYQGLQRLTQLSDFVARYTLYQHLITRKKDRMSSADAIQEASDAFVNYDIPMHRYLQYTDDMGLTMFTKYFLRIQRVLAKTVSENTGRVLMSLLLAKYLNLGATVLEESSMWTHFGRNPFHTGAFMFFDDFFELPTIKSAMTVFETGAAAPAIKAVAKVAGLPG